MGNDFKIYLICGKAHSGKSTIAQIIKNYFLEKNKKFIITEYSKYLKLYAHEILDWNYDEKLKPRAFLQDLGIVIRENISLDNFFVNRIMEDIKVYQKFCSGVIISDVRFPEEIEALKKNYPFVCSILVQSENEQSTLNEKEKKHISEQALNNYHSFDYRVKNDDSISKLKEKIIKIIKE